MLRVCPAISLPRSNRGWIPDNRRGRSDRTRTCPRLDVEPLGYSIRVGGDHFWSDCVQRKGRISQVRHAKARHSPETRERAEIRLRRLTRSAVIAATGATALIGIIVAKEHPGASSGAGTDGTVPLPSTSTSTSPSTTSPTTSTPVTSPPTTAPSSPESVSGSTTAPATVPTTVAPTTTTTSPPTTTTTRPVVHSGGTSR
jgi:hypothetical protein